MHVLLIVLAFAILLSVAPQTLPPMQNTTIAPVISPVNKNHSLAMDGDQASGQGVPAFYQTNPTDGQDFWCDGFNFSIANSKDYHNMVGIEIGFRMDSAQVRVKE